MKAGAAVRRRRAGRRRRQRPRCSGDRRPDADQCNGDRVRLAYRVASTAEGVWQGGTVIRGDGIVHANTSSQVRFEVVDQAEQCPADRRAVVRL